MEPQIRDCLGSLIEARGAVLSEMERLAAERPLNRRALAQLRDSAHGYATKADALLVTMARGETPEVLLLAVEEIFDALRDAEGQIEAVIRIRNEPRREVYRAVRREAGV
jgi:hypothetical protein